MPNPCDVIYNDVRVSKQDFIHGLLDHMKLTDEELSSHANYLQSIGYNKSVKSIQNEPSNATSSGDNNQRAGQEKEVQNKNGAATKDNTAAEHPATGGPDTIDHILEARHSDTEHDEQDIVSGQNQLGLSDIGREKAHALKEEVADEHDVKKIIHSDLPRAAETAAIVSDGKIRTEARKELRSWDLKDFGGMKDADFKPIQKYFVDHPDEIEHQGKKLGESFNQYKDRVIKAREEVAKEPEGTMLINHSNNIAIYDAYKNNGDQWNEQAVKDYMATKMPEPASIVHAPGEGEAADALDRGEIPDSQIKKHLRDAISEYVSQAKEKPTEPVRGKGEQHAGTVQNDAGAGQERTSPDNEKRLSENDKGVPAEKRTTENGAKPVSADTKAPDDFERKVKKIFGVKDDEVRAKIGETDNKAPETAGKLSAKGYTIDRKNESMTTPKGDRIDIYNVRDYYSNDGLVSEGNPLGDMSEADVKLILKYFDKEAREEGLKRLGEKSETPGKKTPPAYGSVDRALKSVADEHPDDPQIQRAVKFLGRILGGNTKVHIEDADLGGRVLGLAHPDGKVQVDFSAHSDIEEAHRTLLHELMHQATRGEIVKNAAFRNEVRTQLEQIREGLKLPKGDLGDTLIPALVDRGVIPAEKYGAANEHELLAEVFTNKKFRDLLSDMKSPENPKQNMLQQIYQKIVQYFDKKYGALQDLKGKITAKDMAEYLQQLTEGAVKESAEGKPIPYAKLKGETDIEAEVRRLVADHQEINDLTMKKAIMAWGTGKITEAQIDRIIKEQRQLSPLERLMQRLEDEADEKKNIDEAVKERDKLSKEEKKDIQHQKDLKIADRLKAAVNDIVTRAAVMKSMLVNVPKYDGMEKAIGVFSRERNISAKKILDFQKDFIKQVPDPMRREAITNWIEAGGDLQVLEQRWRDSGGRYKGGYALAQHLLPSEVAAAKEIGRYYNEMFEMGFAHGILKSQIEDYISHIGVKKDNPIIRKFMGDMDAGKLNSSFDYAKKRTFETLFEAEKAGYGAKTKDAARILGIYDASFNRAINSRIFLKNLSKGKATDGRPLVSMAGTGNRVTNPEEEFADGDKPSEATFINTTGKPQRYADYVPVNHPAMHGWYFATDDGNGNPVFVKGSLNVHPEEAKRMKAILERSTFGDNLAGKIALKYSTAAKQMIFSLSPFFHPVQLGVHGLGHTVNPFSVKTPDLNDPFVVKAMEGGLMLYDHNPNSLFQEGLSGGSFAKNIPVIGQALHSMSEHTFQDYLPGLKMKTYEHAFERNNERNEATKATVQPKIDALDKQLKQNEVDINALNKTLTSPFPGNPADIKKLGFILDTKQAQSKNLQTRMDALNKQILTEGQLHRQTSDQMNAAYGGLNYDMIGRSKYAQDWFRTLSLAPDFLEARARFVGQAFTKYGAEQKRALIVLGGGMYIMARMLNKLMDDDYHWDKPFSVVHNGQEYRMRSVPEDMFELYNNWQRFIYNRLSPVGQTLFENPVVGPGYDPIRQRKINFQEWVKDMSTAPLPTAAKEFLPDDWNKFPVKPAQDRMWETFWNTIGVRDTKYQTGTQKDIIEKFYESFPKGKQSEDSKIESQIYKAADQGDQDKMDELMSKLTTEQQKTINRNIREGRSFYEYMFSRLPKEDKIDLYNKMTDEEKQQYDPKNKTQKLIDELQ